MADRKKMEGHCSTVQSPQWAVVPMEEEEEEEEKKKKKGQIQERIERRSRKRSLSAGSEKMERVCGR